MRKYILGLSAGLLIASSVSVYASNEIKAYLFPVSVSVNQNEINYSKNYATINYEGSAYVPLRFFAEYMGAKVEYNDSYPKINIHTFDQDNVKSMINSKDKDNFFEMASYSKNLEYSSDEPIYLWSTLNYMGSNSLTITHGEPLITYSLSDSEGFEISSGTNQILIKEVWNEGDQLRTTFPLALVEEYNTQKSKQNNLEIENKHPWLLTPGSYKISAHLKYKTNNQTNILKNEIKLLVK
ncbi:copper amine oxidase N-terminal domain-containing protein [Paenibacillus sp. HWE-109]|uniref:stalk domain-containing protein n=1 Tax=Paenibacillus sp. HWE-109 TaxID=1306526 RepID=UPI001EE0842C|nr:stalk domain-containing protein [Paenibacillus sp. HWE-109]UKS25250.1 copper amine oxidase N-terminal domain-containing protein [Paenibacillus sp. HWE-109]